MVAPSKFTLKVHFGINNFQFINLFSILLPLEFSIMVHNFIFLNFESLVRETRKKVVGF